MPAWWKIADTVEVCGRGKGDEVDADEGLRGEVGD